MAKKKKSKNQRTVVGGEYILKLPLAKDLENNKDKRVSSKSRAKRK